MSQQQHEAKKEKIAGVFSSQEVRKVGTGTTTRKTIQKTLWFAQEQEDGMVEVQPINLNYVPSGPKKKLSLDEFLGVFSPEPEVYMTSVYPKIRELNKTIARADRHRANGESFSAEMEYNNALRVDEENVRANFGLGITYLERGDTHKADNIFSRLIKLEAAFEEQHKHLFNEFGINLRKNGMLDQALEYYGKAADLAHEDVHLYYNMARAYLEKKDMEQTLTWLLRALRLTPSFDTGVKFLLWMWNKSLVPEARRAEVAEVVALIKAAARSAPPVEGAPATQPASADAPAPVSAEATAPAAQATSEEVPTEPLAAGGAVTQKV